MSKLNPIMTGLSAAITFAIVNAICALSFALFPDSTLNFFNAWFHGLDLRLLTPAGGVSFTPGKFLYGLAGVSATGFVTGFLFAVIDNFWRR